MSGLLEFCLNPTFGKLSDRIGRRPFFLVGPAYVFLGNAVLAVFAKNLSPSMLPLILVNSLLRKVAATVSGSVASVTALSDVSSGRAFAINISKLWVRVSFSCVRSHNNSFTIPNRLTLEQVLYAHHSSADTWKMRSVLEVCTLLHLWVVSFN